MDHKLETYDAIRKLKTKYGPMNDTRSARHVNLIMVHITLIRSRLRVFFAPKGKVVTGYAFCN